MLTVEVSFEVARWCGYRSPSKNGYGIYLIGPANFQPCERLPFPLETCPCCGGGVKPSRSFTWINPATLFDPWSAQPKCCEMTGEVIDGLEHDHHRCALCNPIVVAGEQAGLIWIGEQHYKTARLFMEEAMSMGISRKVGALPLGFEVGKHMVYLAHKKTATRSNPETHDLEWVQGVFTAFRPIRVDIVIDDPDNVPEKAIELAKRLGDSARLIKVVPLEEEGAGSDGEDW